MYLKEKLIRLLKVKNVIFLILGVFFVSLYVGNIISLCVYYFGDWDTVLTARSMPESVIMILIGTLMIVISRVSRKHINDAALYSAYFEGDLDGYVAFSELAEVTGEPLAKFSKHLRRVLRLYMKNYVLRTDGGADTVELYSKKISCECRNCGAPIEKRIYFTGQCPYCAGSDLFAKVISGNKFYSISSDFKRGVNKPSYYAGNKLEAKKLFYIISLAIFTTAFVIILANLFTLIHRYNDQEYLKWLLLSGNTHYSSYELIKKHMMDDIIFLAFFATAIFCAFPFISVRLFTLRCASRYSVFFSKHVRPFISLEELDKFSGGNSTRELRRITSALRERYLRNSSPEKHSGALQIGLAKQIVKDKCPYCSAAIVGAVDENYTCRYCGRTIMDVIRKPKA